MWLNGKKQSRERLFTKAMLPRRGKIIRRNVVRGEEKNQFWITASLWAAFLLVSGQTLLFSPALMIQTVTVEGESVIPSIEYQTLAEEEMARTMLGIFKQRNFFLVPTERIVARILERYPKVSSVFVERKFPDRIVLRLTEAPVLLRWCSGGPCYGIRDGRAVTVPFADDIRYESTQLSVIDLSALPVEVGEPLPVEPYVNTFYAARERLAKFTQGTPSLIATTPSRYSEEIVMVTGENWKLSLSTTRPVEESLGTLRIFLDEYGKDRPDRSKLQSVDLRIDGRIFYTETDAAVIEVLQP